MKIDLNNLMNKTKAKNLNPATPDAMPTTEAELTEQKRASATPAQPVAVEERPVSAAKQDGFARNKPKKNRFLIPDADTSGPIEVEAQSAHVAEERVLDANESSNNADKPVRSVESNEVSLENDVNKTVQTINPDINRVNPRFKAASDHLKEINKAELNGKLSDHELTVALSEWLDKYQDCETEVLATFKEEMTERVIKFLDNIKKEKIKVKTANEGPTRNSQYEGSKDAAQNATKSMIDDVASLVGAVAGAAVGVGKGVLGFGRDKVNDVSQKLKKQNEKMANQESTNFAGKAEKRAAEHDFGNMHGQERISFDKACAALNAATISGVALKKVLTDNSIDMQRFGDDPLKAISSASDEVKNSSMNLFCDHSENMKTLSDLIDSHTEEISSVGMAPNLGEKSGKDLIERNNVFQSMIKESSDILKGVPTCDALVDLGRGKNKNVIDNLVDNETKKPGMLEKLKNSLDSSAAMNGFMLKISNMIAKVLAFFGISKAAENQADMSNESQNEPKIATPSGP